MPTKFHIARDSNNALYLYKDVEEFELRFYQNPAFKSVRGWYARELFRSSEIMRLNEDVLPEITHEMGPVEVELVIKERTKS